jgi:hypothetical protein
MDGLGRGEVPKETVTDWAGPCCFLQFSPRAHLTVLGSSAFSVLVSACSLGPTHEDRPPRLEIKSYFPLSHTHKKTRLEKLRLEQVKSSAFFHLVRTRVFNYMHIYRKLLILSLGNDENLQTSYVCVFNLFSKKIE